MRRCVALGLAAAVFAVLLAFTGAAAAAETVDFSSGTAVLPLDSIDIGDGDTLKVNVEISNLEIKQDGSPLKVTIGGFNDILQDITLDSFTVKLFSEGIDAGNSPISAGLAFFTIPLGKSLADFSHGMTITKDMSVPLLGKVIDELPNLYSMKVEVLPSDETSSLKMVVDAKVNEGSSIQPDIKISVDDASRIKTNPKISISAVSNQDSISKTYSLDVSNVNVPTAEPTEEPEVEETPEPTLTPTASPTTLQPTERPTDSLPASPAKTTVPVSATPFPETPVPLFGIAAALSLILCLCVLKRR